LPPRALRERVAEPSRAEAAGLPAAVGVAEVDLQAVAAVEVVAEAAVGDRILC